MSVAEIELMEKYCRGDADAFRQLYQLLAPRLRVYLLRLVGDSATADDLLQQTFLKVHRARASYVAGAAPGPWMYAIAHRTFIDETRRRKRARVRLSSDGEVRDAEAAIEQPTATDGPDRELVGQVMEALKKLPESQREAVVLTKLQGKSVAEAAAIADTTVGAMKVRAHRGYAALRKLCALPTRGTS